MDFLYIAGAASIAALVFAIAKYGAIMKADAGDSKMQEISKQVQDGAAAFLVSDTNTIADYKGQASIANELQDQWRIEGEAFTHSWEDRFVVQEGYSPRLVEAVRALLDKTDAQPDDFAKVALYAPDARSHAAVLRQLRPGPESASSVAGRWVV